MYAAVPYGTVVFFAIIFIRDKWRITDGLG